MGNPTGFLEIQRKNLVDQDPKSRVSHWQEFHEKMPKDDLESQASRCMDCGVPFCHTGVQLESGASGCPINNLIPDWNDMLYRDQWQEALKLLLKTNNFPEFTGRVCPAPCEGSCVLGINEPPVTIKNHEYSIIENAFSKGWIKANPPKSRTGKNVAIIGSGPAGLAAADEINKFGHSVTVYERDDRIGGLLMYGIPNMKLDKKMIVDRRVELLKEEGIVFKINIEIGRDISFQDLKAQYDALIIATGSTIPRDLIVEGRDSTGIHFAMEFLKLNTKSLLDSELKDGDYISAKGKKVVVIGGGDTGTDCVATSLRHECESITQLEIMSKPPEIRSSNNPWPEYPLVYNLDYGQEEAAAIQGEDPRKYTMMTKSFESNSNGEVTALNVVEVEWAMNDGKAFPKEVEGTNSKIEADLVLLAMGFIGPEKAAFKDTIDFDLKGNIVADYGKYETSEQGVFAAGDCRRGQSLVVWAINEGRGVSVVCDEFLKRG